MKKNKNSTLFLIVFATSFRFLMGVRITPVHQKSTEGVVIHKTTASTKAKLEQTITVKVRTKPQPAQSQKGDNSSKTKSEKTANNGQSRNLSSENITETSLKSSPQKEFYEISLKEPTKAASASLPAETTVQPAPKVSTYIQRQNKRLEQAQQDLVTRLPQTFDAREQQATTLQYLKEQKPSLLAEFLISAPIKSNDQSPISKGQVLRAISSSMADFLGINKLRERYANSSQGKIIENKVTATETTVEQEVNTVVNNPKLNTQQKETRIRQILQTMMQALSDLAAQLGMRNKMSPEKAKEYNQYRENEALQELADSAPRFNGQSNVTPQQSFYSEFDHTL
jgi:hypothetical protein